MSLSEMSIGERIVLAASLATTQHVLKSVEQKRKENQHPRAEQKIADQASNLRALMHKAA